MDEHPREPSPTDSTADWRAYWQPHYQQITEALNATPATAHHWDLLQRLLHHGVRTGNAQYVANRIKHETPFEHLAKIISDLDHRRDPRWGTALLGITLSLISIGQGAGMFGASTPPQPAAPAQVVQMEVDPHARYDADPPTPSEPEDPAQSSSGYHTATATPVEPEGLTPSSRSPRPADELLHQSFPLDLRDLSPAQQEAIRQAADTYPIHLRQQPGDTSSP